MPDVSIAYVGETWFKAHMGDDSFDLHGFCLERKESDHDRVGDMACYIRNDVLYKRLNDLVVDELEVIWVKIMPKTLPRTCSCILLACIYYTPKTEYLEIRT